MKRQGEAGISVMELVVVLLLIATIAAIALPNVSSALRSYRVQIAAQAIAQQLNRCRQRAVSVNRPVSVRFRTVPPEAVMDTNFNDEFGDDGGAGVPPDDPPSPIVINGVTLVSADDPITRRFTSRGELPIGTEPSTQTITVQFRGRQRSVTIDPRGAVSMGPEVAAS